MQELHRNIPQLLVELVDAQITVCRWGRGTGKTNQISRWTHSRVKKMPRSGGSIVGSTYTHLLTKLAPGIIKGWQDMGLVQDVHFWFNKFPPKNFKIPTGYSPLLSPKYAIFFYNGAYIQFLSADRGLNNALNADFHAFDEARFLAQDKVREIALTTRGNASHFGGNYYHGSLLFTSDAPRSAKSQWFNEYEKQMDIEKVEMIKKVATYSMNYRWQYSQTKSESKRYKLQRKINEYDAMLNELRTGAVFFSRASTIDNIHALGPQAIWNFRKLLSPSDYLISVLNRDSIASPNCFYPLLNSEIHGFHGENSAYIESLDISIAEAPKKDCLWKSPRYYNSNAELDIALDYNNAINCLAVGQGDYTEFRLLNSLFVLGENNHYLKDVVMDFCKFYRHHKNKSVNFYYDNTAVAKDASGRVEYHKEVQAILQKEGWTVRMKRITQASRHEDRFMLWLRLLSGQDDRLPQFNYDLDDCAQWQTSAENAGVKQSDRGFKKDKSTETKKDKDGNHLIRPEDSTHLSEAVDMLIDGKYGNRLSHSGGGFVDASYA